MCDWSVQNEALRTTLQYNLGCLREPGTDATHAVGQNLREGGDSEASARQEAERWVPRMGAQMMKL